MFFLKKINWQIYGTCDKFLLNVSLQLLILKRVFGRGEGHCWCLCSFGGMRGRGNKCTTLKKYDFGIDPNVSFWFCFNLYGECLQYIHNIHLESMQSTRRATGVDFHRHIWIHQIYYSGACPSETSCLPFQAWTWLFFTTRSTPPPTPLKKIM